MIDEREKADNLKSELDDIESSMSASIRSLKRKVLAGWNGKEVYKRKCRKQAEVISELKVVILSLKSALEVAWLMHKAHQRFRRTGGKYPSKEEIRRLEGEFEKTKSLLK